MKPSLKLSVRSVSSKTSEDSRPIGLFGGTFNPVHSGHLNLARALMERKGLSEVWFIPAALSPFPKESLPASGKDRLKMLELSIRHQKGFSILSIELEREPPSYTIDTLRQILTQYPEKKFCLLMGEDVALEFYLWKEAEAIVALLPLVIGSRAEVHLLEKVDQLPTSQSIKNALKEGICETPLFDISARELRAKLYKEDCSQFVPKEVLDYIYKNHLYYNDN